MAEIFWEEAWKGRSVKMHSSIEAVQKLVRQHTGIRLGREWEDILLTRMTLG